MIETQSFEFQSFLKAVRKINTIADILECCAL